MAGRKWTTEEDAVLVAGYRRGAAPELAARLGRTVPAIRQRCELIGLAKRKRKRPAWTAEFEARYRGLHAEGKTDGEAAAELGVDRAWLNGHRRRLGLSSNKGGARHRERIRGQVRHQLAAAGVATLADLMHARRRRFAARYGLPTCLQPRAVQIVLALAAGPKTKSQICAVIGMTYNHANHYGQKSLNAGRGRSSYLTQLRKLDLIQSTRVPGTGGRKPGEQYLYALTPLALSLLAQPRTGDASIPRLPQEPDQ